MNRFLYYFDKFTAWLDFSWLVTRPRKTNINTTEWYEDEPPYETKSIQFVSKWYESEPLISS
jgi:hypothetical protein